MFFWITPQRTWISLLHRLSPYNYYESMWNFETKSNMLFHNVKLCWRNLTHQFIDFKCSIFLCACCSLSNWQCNTNKESSSCAMLSKESSSVWAIGRKMQQWKDENGRGPSIQRKNRTKCVEKHNMFWKPTRWTILTLMSSLKKIIGVF